MEKWASLFYFSHRGQLKGAEMHFRRSEQRLGSLTCFAAMTFSHKGRSLLFCKSIIGCTLSTANFFFFFPFFWEKNQPLDQWFYIRPHIFSLDGTMLVSSHPGENAAVHLLAGRRGQKSVLGVFLIWSLWSPYALCKNVWPCGKWHIGHTNCSAAFAYVEHAKG